MLKVYDLILQGGADAARVAQKDLEQTVPQSSSPGPAMQRVSEERTPEDAKPGRPPADPQISGASSQEHVHNLLGDGLVAQKHDRPKGLGSSQPLPQHRPGTMKGRKHPHGVTGSKASSASCLIVSMPTSEAMRTRAEFSYFTQSV